ncbi:uncharacterized protein METZ01_LOCUS204057 [marine metagenome]|uniref:Uncharacterized protein n=1 Tax=marine metagenome TaxID=408172 RepID=A0A382EMQ8_9ZZZZ
MSGNGSKTWAWANTPRASKKRPLQRRDLEASERTLGPDDEDTLTLKQNFGVFLRERGRPEEAIPLLEEILATRCQRAKGEPTAKLSSTLTALGTTLGTCGRHDEGGKNLETPLASTLKRLADVYEQVGKEKQAAQARAEAWALEGEENA